MTRTKTKDEKWPDAWIGGKARVGVDPDSLVRKVPNDDTFHIGQVYEDSAAVTVECAGCGGRQFNLGTSSYFTAIRCPACGWEVCFHDG